MEWYQLIALVLSGAIGISLGLLGGGGSILAVPVLVYVAGVEAKTAVAMSLAIVGATSFTASLLHWRAGRLDWRTAALFSLAGSLGAYLGAQLTPLVTGTQLLALFALLMLIVAILMLRKKAPATAGAATATPTPTAHTNQMLRSSSALLRVLLAGFGVGVITGFLGVGGGFLIVPALVLFASLPMHQAVGTSLLVIAANSAAGLVGHWRQGGLPLWQTAAFTAAAITGTFIGTTLAKHVSAQQLRHAFAVFVLLVAIVLLVANRHAFF